MVQNYCWASQAHLNCCLYCRCGGAGNRWLLFIGMLAITLKAGKMTCLIGGVAVLLVTVTTWATQTFIVPLAAT